MSLIFQQRADPLSELNTTPLIDIMLVLLVMLIFTLPPLTNSVELPLPSRSPHHPIIPDKMRNLITVTASDVVLWNGQPVSEDDLDALLREAAAFRPEPELELAPDGSASYEKSVRVLRLVKLSGATRVGFVGNERYRDFGN